MVKKERRFVRAQFLDVMWLARLSVFLLHSQFVKHQLSILNAAIFMSTESSSPPPSNLMPTMEKALPGRTEKMIVSPKHAVNGNPTIPPFPQNMKFAMFGMGCFWGAEKTFWQQTGVFSTQVGYSGSLSQNPSYLEVCSGQTGHSEVIRVVFDPQKTSYSKLLKVFWENHNPTQGMRQNNDVGTQYRSGIYYYDEEQKQLAESTMALYQQKLTENQYGRITTEIAAAGKFYYAEDYHQQYLHKNPRGYCGVGGTGISCPIEFAGQDKL